MNSIRVWDLPVRLCHWLLVCSILGLYITAQLGSEWMEWHKRLGYASLGLVSFRVVWGFVGSHHARFANFLRRPSAVGAYAKSLVAGRAKQFLGHNPMGALSMIALLASVGFQAVTGLFANDDIDFQGPYASLVSKALSNRLTGLHKLNSDLLLILIGLHVAAILYYVLYKRENLVKAMVTGEKNIAASASIRDAQLAGTPRPAWLSWLVAVGAAMFTYAVAMRFFV
jgi:cytochrome b